MHRKTLFMNIFLDKSGTQSPEDPDPCCGIRSELNKFS